MNRLGRTSQADATVLGCRRCGRDVRSVCAPEPPWGCPVGRAWKGEGTYLLGKLLGSGL